MGVPKFFRYTSERYPCLNELVKQYQIPDFDNMYLDMNGIIHNCSHPDDSDPHFRISEEKIFQDIFHYISILFQIIKPKKLFFMAIDGVAPRAKMNQQRGRRFRSAREAEKLEEEAKAKGEVLPTEKRFDSNCITPGTVFMSRLHQQLRYFVKQKISTDPLWSKVKVILSGHETPGEGEHKIMDYIRWARAAADYDPNTRHCLYGLDADLIMLGVCTHEPHFALLREEVKFGRSTQRATSPEETNFYLLHLSLLREYLEQEFISIKDSLPFEYDLEKIVDDWVLMGFLVGNDFIPHLPHMHIGNDALPLLYNTYMKVLPTLDGYINEAGDLNLERFEIFMQELAKIDKEKFQDVYADLKYFEAKTGRRPNAQERKEYKPNNDETFNVDVDDIKNNKPDDELQALINATQDMFMDDVDDLEEYEETSDEEDNMEKEFLLHKKDYYMNKLDYSKVTNEVLADQAEGYVRAIQWNLFYYYKGCPSWCWYYPHHYAPYISDIKGFKDLKIEFELGEPFKPFEQLLAVLPAASKQLLPAPFHDLMTDEDSPIVHYYPVHFETDLNGKRNDWEAVVLIPFIDEANLLSAMAPCYQRLTDEELQRNTHGPMLMYDWTANSQGVALAPEYFPAIPDCHALETRIWRQELELSPERLRRGALPNAHTDKIFPGFPTMKHLEYTTSLRKGRVKVFDQPSRNESMIVQLKQKPQPALEAAARDLLGRVVWVGWPHLTRAKVISVSNEKMRLHHVDKQNNNVSDAPSYSSEANLGNLHKQWISERSTIIEHNMNRLGIDLGEVNIIVHAVNLKGHKYIIQDNVSMVLSPEWCSVACGYARQAVLRDAPHVQHETVRYRSLGDAYPPGERVFLLTQGQYYGCRATVVDSEAIRSGRMKVCVSVSPQPVPAPAAAAPYRSAHHAAAQCGISSQLLSRVTGSVLVVLGERHNLPTEQLSKINIGLNLKFNKKNLEVCGFTRRSGTVGGAGGGAGAWQYSGRCVALVQAYAARYPQLFQRLAVRNDSDIFFESDLWPDEVGEKKPQEVQSWLKSQPHATAGRRECGSLALEPEELRALWDGLRPQLQALKTQESTVTLQVKWNLLYKLERHQKKKKSNVLKATPTLTLEPEELRALWDGLRPQLQALKMQESTVTLQVKWNLLYKAELHEGNLQPDPSADFKLYDRVVCVSPNIAVPAGSTGTVTATLAPPAANTCRLSDKLNAEHTYQVMFDEPFAGGMCEQLFDETRFYRMSGCHMLNLSYGRKLRTSARAAAAPTLLRRDDGHHSAFASYSPPTAENKTQQEVRPITNNVVNNGQDNVNNATHLLRSLLKISEDEEATKKKNNKSPADSNWRNKQPPQAQPPPQHPPPPHRMQPPPNWRKEMGGAPPQLFPNEWTNTTFKGGPNGGVLPSGGPGAAHVPFPQFPGFAPGPPPPQPPRPVFPPHLPPVAANITLGPSWVQGQCQKPAGGAGRAAATPFVPLQVQTSQRRIQNSTTGAPPRHEAPPAAPPPPPAAAVREQKQASTTRPQKKKKPRIAANLPFQIE